LCLGCMLSTADTVHSRLIVVKASYSTPKSYGPLELNMILLKAKIWISSLIPTYFQALNIVKFIRLNIV
jgi:hypothetical protein